MESRTSCIVDPFETVMTTNIAIVAQMRAYHPACIDILIWVTVLLIVIVGGSFAIRKIRIKSLQHELNAEELLTKFRDCYTKGELNDEEFRKIKSMLMGEIEAEVKVKGNKG